MVRLSGAIGTAALVLAAVGLFLATRDGPGIAGYVSESGVAGAPHDVLYQLSIFLLALAAAGVALALRPVAGWAALAVALAVPCLVLSGAARCSAGCPLPPYRDPTLGDLLHAGASIAATGLCALAMLAAARWATDRPLRTVSRWGAVVSLPVLFAMAAALLGLGRGPVTGGLERVSITCCLAWLATVSTLRVVLTRR